MIELKIDETASNNTNILDLKNDPIFTCRPILIEDATLNLTYRFEVSHFFTSNNTVDPNYDIYLFSSVIGHQYFVNKKFFHTGENYQISCFASNFDGYK